MKQTNIKQTLELAVAPLKAELAELKTEVLALKAELAPVLAAFKPQELPAPVKEAKAVLDGIPKEILAELQVVNVGFDGTKPWFVLVRANGTKISVKKTHTNFRVRHRDHAGKLLKELTPPFNGLVATLKSLA